MAVRPAETGQEPEDGGGRWPPGWRVRAARAMALPRAVLSRALSDGLIHAGNFAYLSLVTLLPLTILLTAAAAAFGQTEAGRDAIAGLLYALPPRIADVFAPVIDDVVSGRTGRLLWLGGLVALWTVTGLIETMRDIIHRAFRTPPARHALTYRLHSIFGLMVAMLLVMAAFLSQVALVVAVRSMELIQMLSMELPPWVDLSRTLPPFLVFLSLWALMKLLAPAAFRRVAAWPGALVTTLVWAGGTFLIGPVLARFDGISLTYGALSGVMVAMLFFYAVGFALVLGAELNAALAKRGARA